MRLWRMNLLVLSAYAIIGGLVFVSVSYTHLTLPTNREV